MLVPPPELETNVSLWLWAVSQYKARVTFCSYSVMEMCARGLGAQTAALRVSAGGPGETPGTVPVGRSPQHKGCSLHRVLSVGLSSPTGCSEGPLIK